MLLHLLNLHLTNKLYICTTLPTSDYKVDAFHIIGIVWILDGVNPLVSFSHRLYNQVRLVAVELSPVVCRHFAVVQQSHIIPPFRVLERHIELDGGQRDVKIFPEEESDLFIICNREKQK